MVAGAAARANARPPVPDVRAPNLARSTRRGLVAGAIVVLVGAGGAAAWATTSTTTPGYVTATSARGDVIQLLDLTGTATQSDQATATFPSGGLVSSVSVTLGQHVAVGRDRKANEIAPRIVTPGQHAFALRRGLTRRRAVSFVGA